MYKNTLIYLVGGAVAAGGNFLLGPIYISLLTVEEYGLWAQFNLALQMLQPILCWGMLAAMTRLVAGADKTRRREVIISGIKFVTIVNIFIFITSIVFLDYYKYLIAMIFGVREDVQGYFVVLSIMVAGLAVYPQILLGIYAADGRAVSNRLLNLIGFFLQMVFIIVFSALFIYEVAWAMIGMVAASAIYALYSIRQIRCEVGWGPVKDRFNEVILYGFPIVLYTLAGQGCDLITRGILSKHVDNFEFGVFSVGLLYASLIAMISSAVNMAWIPKYYRNAEDLVQSGVYAGYVTVFAGIMSIISAFLIVFSEEILLIYSRGKIITDSWIVALLVVSAWLNSAVWMGFANPIFENRKPTTVLIISTISLVISIPLALLYIPEFEQIAVGVLMMFNACMMCVLAGVVTRNIKNIRIFCNSVFFQLVGLVLLGYMTSMSNYYEYSMIYKIGALSFFFTFIYFLSIKKNAKFLKDLLSK